MSGRHVAAVYRRWLRDRRRSTSFWTFGLAAIVVMTAAFYPSLENAFSDITSSGGMASLLGLSDGIDPSSPLGFLWANLYANIVPWVLMALGIALGTAAIAGDEDTGTLEYLLSKPVTRSEIVVARVAGMVTIVFVVAAISGVLLLAVAPFVDLTSAQRTTDAAGAAVTNPGLDAGHVFAGTFAAAAVGLGTGAVAFLVGSATGRKSLATGIATGTAVGGYLLYTLANVTGSVTFLTWLSPWRWYVDDAMFIHGLGWAVALPFGLLVACVALGWARFLHRDLES